MSLVHDTSRCFAEAIGTDGLDHIAFERVLQQTAPSIDKLAAIHEKAALPLLELPTARDDLIQPAAVAERLRSSDQVLLFGTGGSSLGGQTLPERAEIRVRPPPGRRTSHL